jgi:hypothetical protein
MNIRKIAAATLLSTLSVSAFAADVIVSDGRSGGAYWNQPIQRGGDLAAFPVGKVVIGQIDASDGQSGGAYWNNAQAGKVTNTTVAASEQFVATSQVKGAFSFLEDYNP